MAFRIAVTSLPGCRESSEHHVATIRDYTTSHAGHVGPRTYSPGLYSTCTSVKDRYIRPVHLLSVPNSSATPRCENSCEIYEAQTSTDQISTGAEALFISSKSASVSSSHRRKLIVRIASNFTPLFCFAQTRIKKRAYRLPRFCNSISSVTVENSNWGRTRVHEDKRRSRAVISRALRPTIMPY